MAIVLLAVLALPLLVAAVPPILMFLLLKENAYADPVISRENRQVLLALACNLISVIGYVRIGGTHSWQTDAAPGLLNAVLVPVWMAFALVAIYPAAQLLRSSRRLARVNAVIFILLMLVGATTEFGLHGLIEGLDTMG